MHKLLIDILIFFVGVSAVLYIILGGADYGAGILELLPAKKMREKQKQVINSAMGPIWEANHMWLIIIIVILFIGFPKGFYILSVNFHIPIVFLLVGIVLRGTAFAVRHYDAVQEPTSQKIYTWLFGVSSLWTSFWLGAIASSLFSGKIDLHAKTFFQAYISAWYRWESFMGGIFTISIFSYLAAIYLIGESSNQKLIQRFKRYAMIANISVIFSGGLIFLISYLDQSPLFSSFSRYWFSLFCMLLATLFFIAQWYWAKTAKTIVLRLIAALQVSLILLGWFGAHAPHIVISSSERITFYNASAPTSTLFQLVLALLIGSLFIFPSLFFLLKTFKFNNVNNM